MKSWFPGFVLLLTCNAPAGAEDSQIDRFLEKMPHEYKIVAPPEPWEGEGMRGYSADVDVHGRAFKFVATCENQDFNNWFKSAPEVAVLWENDGRYFELAAPGTNELKRPEYDYEVIPIAFHREVCLAGGQGQAASGNMSADPSRVQNRDDILTLQTVLNILGFDAGKADGIFGSRTRRALIAFQREYGLPPTGQMDVATEQAVARSFNRAVRAAEDQ